MSGLSTYSLECVCGHHLESETTKLICPSCHRLVLIEWPAKAEEKEVSNPITIRIAA